MRFQGTGVEDATGGPDGPIDVLVVAPGDRREDTTVYRVDVFADRDRKVE